GMAEGKSQGHMDRQHPGVNEEQSQGRPRDTWTNNIQAWTGNRVRGDQGPHGQTTSRHGRGTESGETKGHTDRQHPGVDEEHSQGRPRNKWTNNIQAWMGNRVRGDQAPHGQTTSRHG
ncbi:hypothetical protein LSAT2_018143, partial [Lamellibrachia satsuma]